MVWSSSQSLYREHQSRKLIYHLHHSLAPTELSLNTPSAVDRQNWQSFLLVCWEEGLDLPSSIDPCLICYKARLLGQGFEDGKESLKSRQLSNGLERWIYVTAIGTGLVTFKSSVCTICSLLIFRVTYLIPLLNK